MRILLYNPDNGVTRNFMPHLWMFLLQALTPSGHEVLLIDGNAQPIVPSRPRRGRQTGHPVHRFVVGAIASTYDLTSPPVLNLRMSLRDGHLQWCVGHLERYELLPMLGPRKSPRSLQPLVKRRRGQGGE